MSFLELISRRELWHPPGARGVFGGAVIAQSLAAACMTVPSISHTNENAVFLPHSMHCYFVLAGDSNIPILYHVERVREGRSFLTRTVQARQKGKCIFTTTVSFMREGSGGQESVQHGWDMPSNARKEMVDLLEEDRSAKKGSGSLREHEATKNGVQNQGPFVSKRLGIHNGQPSACSAVAHSSFLNINAKHSNRRLAPSPSPKATNLDQMSR